MQIDNLDGGRQGGTMTRRAMATIATAIAVLAAAATAAAQPAPGFTELDSVSSAGVQGNQDSELPAVSERR